MPAAMRQDEGADSPSTPAAQPAPSSERVWSEADLAQNPHNAADKPERVQRMFAAIARRYDLNNRLHSLWRDQAWRREAVREASVRPGDEVLDAACGTGDLTRLFASTRARRVVGLDFTADMLAIARKRQERDLRRNRPAASRIEYVQGDAMNLPFDDATFNVVSIAFGIRNVAEPERALAAFRRVLKPGGRLIVLEFSQPRNAILAALHRVYTHRVMPVTATWLSRDTTGAYRYLPRSVEAFLDRERMVGAIRDAGFAAVIHRPLTFGVCVCYRGVAPAQPAATPKAGAATRPEPSRTRPGD